MASRRRSHSRKGHVGPPGSQPAPGGNRGGHRLHPGDRAAYAQMNREDLIEALEQLQASGGTAVERLLEDLRIHQEELKTQADQLQLANSELERSRDRYVELYDSAPVAYITLDTYAVIREINLTGTVMLNRERRHLLGAPLLGFVATHDRDRLMDHMRRCRDNAHAYVITSLELQPPQTAPIPAQLTSRPARDRANPLYQSAITDLTELRAAADRLAESEKHLARAQRLASMGTMAAGIAHEIRNPLNAILMSAEYAREALALPPEAEEVVTSIIRETKRCGEIVRGLLDFARQETTNQICPDVNEVVRQSVNSARHEHQQYPPDIILGLTPALPPIRISPVEIEQIIVNLVRNAVQATIPRCVHLRITTLAVPEGVRLVISDNGPGIPPDLVRRIFDPFYTSRQHQGGTGLGLSIVHTIITQHGGSVHISSQVGKGTTFTIVLPRAGEGGGKPVHTSTFSTTRVGGPPPVRPFVPPWPSPGTPPREK